MPTKTAAAKAAPARKTAAKKVAADAAPAKAPVPRKAAAKKAIVKAFKGGRPTVPIVKS